MKRSSIARNVLNLSVTMSFAFTLGACSTTSEPAPAPPPPRQPASEFSQVVEPEPTTRSVGADISSQLQAIYFDFDRSEIRSDARPILRSNAEALRRAQANVVVEGHCDQRGSEEYNFALGESRAHSVMKYLADLGVSTSQMTTVSYGETRPAVSAYTEAAYAKNRRVEFRGR